MPGSQTLTYRFPPGRGAVEVQLAVPELLPLLNKFYRSYRCDPVGVTIRAEISLELTNGRYKLVGPSGDWYADEAGEAVALYEAELTDTLLADTADLIHLHGAAAFGPDGCLVLLGPSSTGKSTLTLGLQLMGLQALTDDVVLIDPNSGRLHPFERALRVHRKALHRLGMRGSIPAGYDICEPYLWALTTASGSEQLPPQKPSAFVFLKRDRQTRLERVSAAETLEGLMVGRFGPGRAARDFECLSGLASRTPGYRLTIRRFPAALTQLGRAFLGAELPAELSGSGAAA